MEILKHLKYFIYISVLFLFSCKSTFYVEKAENSENNTIIYALPKTKIIIQVEITDEIKQKGIFSDFTHLYFNTKNAVLSNSEKFFITDISVKNFPILDSSQFYKIISKNNNNPLLINLSKEGFIFGINLNDVQLRKLNNEQNKLKNTDKGTNVNDYADISLHSIREIQYDTVYKEVLRDSIFIKIPIIRKKEVYKSKAKQAKETAETIFSLRDDRYALLTGENDGNNFPDGKALEKMLNELSKLEKNYMSLFTGREMKIKKIYSYEFIPVKNNIKNDTIFYFSDKKGIVNDINAVPVILNFVPQKRIAEEILSESEKNKGIVYRISGRAELNIKLKNTELYKTELEIPQLGTLNIIPANLFKSKITVEFYPETGSLKRISE